MLLLPALLLALQESEAQVAYQATELRGFPLQVQEDLEAGLRERTLEILDRKLGDIVQELPAAAVERLREVTIWVSEGAGPAPCANYHPSAGWLEANGFDPRKAKGVEINNASAFVEWIHGQPSMVLHELAHAYHDQVLGFRHEGLVRAHLEAEASGRLAAVRRMRGNVQRHYALESSGEWFAEATEAFFGTNDYFPFVRGEFIHADPEGARLVAELWGAPVPREVQRALASPERAAAEVTALHAFFQRWFRGELESTDDAFARVAGALSPDFRLITPDGRTLERQELLDGLRAAHGTRATSIFVDRVAARFVADGLWLVTYREWQAPEGAQPEGRASSALLREDPSAAGGFRWLHVHETALPEDAEPDAPKQPDLVLEGPLADRVRAALAEAALERGLPGATAAVAFPDGSVVSVAVGHAEEGHPLAPGARMLAGSVGKTFFAYAALFLEGANGEPLDLDRTLGEAVEGAWIGSVPGHNATLRQLLRHTSGVPEHVYDPRLAESLEADPDRRWEHAELAQLLVGRDPLFVPGTSWSYADANYVLAGLALEAHLGVDPYGPLLEVTRGLGLADTLPSDRRALPDLVQGHVVLGQRLGWPARTIGEDGQVVRNPQFEWAGGGWVSSAPDLARWARFLWGRADSHPEQHAALTSWSETPAGPGDAYGIATILNRTSDPQLGDALGHDGFFPGYLTSVAYFPELGLGVAVQTNTDDVRAVQGKLFENVLLPVVRAAIP